MNNNASTGTPLLIADRLCHQDGQRLLLNQVSFSLMAGQKVALLGRSGSGKSLLLHALADLLPLQSGEIYLNDSFGLTHHPLAPISTIDPKMYRSRVVLLHQMPSLTEGTVLDNLTLPFSFKCYQDKVFDKDWHLSCLQVLGRDESFLSRSADQLSGGERQIVNFLRSLQFDPSIALFDEITSALDGETADALIRLTLDWYGDGLGKAMMWVTHTPDEAAKLSAQVWHMDNGVLNDGRRV